MLPFVLTVVRLTRSIADGVSASNDVVDIFDFFVLMKILVPHRLIVTFFFASFDSMELLVQTDNTLHMHLSLSVSALDQICEFTTSAASAGATHTSYRTAAPCRRITGQCMELRPTYTNRLRLKWLNAGWLMQSAWWQR
jgi:hypothetical protein